MRLREAMPSLVDKLPVKRAVLFGSWAIDRATAFSDIDVLIVYAGAPRADAYKVARGVFDIRGVELHLYAEAEAEQVRPTLDRMTNHSIDLLSSTRAYVSLSAL